eukprot:Seg1928.5 transcript_id=Seg1928.5/GoldUCD/mRNA.D3Y31 product="Transposable element Tcb2 transposase" protein_id=Seg1928.5/GoldUCD/D3Y31
MLSLGNTRALNIPKRNKCFKNTHIPFVERASWSTKHAKDVEKGIGDRPKKLSECDGRRLLRLVKKLRAEEPNWTVKKLMERADVKNGSVRSIRRFLNQNEYHYLQARKKGLLTNADRKIPVAFAKKMLKDQPANFWCNKIAFYLDGVGFVYKRNPKDQVMAPSGRVWRKRNEGLAQGCTAKGSACGTGGKYVKFIVAISFRKGVICAKSYEKMDGEFFSKFLLENFEEMVNHAGKQSRLWIQDGDPSQNSKLAKQAMTIVNSELLPIPPGSPDLNPIENLFKQVKVTLGKDAIKNNITAETKQDFEYRVRQTLLETPIAIIDNIILSMNKRLKQIIACKGERLKY